MGSLTFATRLIGVFLAVAVIQMLDPDVSKTQHIGKIQGRAEPGNRARH